MTQDYDGIGSLTQDGWIPQQLTRGCLAGGGEQVKGRGKAPDTRAGLGMAAKKIQHKCFRIVAELNMAQAAEF